MMGDFPNESTISKPLKPFQVITVPNQYEDDGRKEHFERRKTSVLKRVIGVSLSIFVAIIALWFALWLMQSKIQSLLEVYDKLEAVEDNRTSILHLVTKQLKKLGLQQNRSIEDTALITTMLNEDALSSNSKVKDPEEVKDELIESASSSFFAILDSITAQLKKIGLQQNRSIEDTARKTTMLNKDAFHFNPEVKESDVAKEESESSSSSSFGEYLKMIFLKLDIKISLEYFF